MVFMILKTNLKTRVRVFSVFTFILKGGGIFAITAPLSKRKITNFSVFLKCQNHVS